MTTITATKPLCPIDFRDDEHLNNPFPAYEWLLADHPVSWDPYIDAWLVAPYDLNRYVLCEAPISSDRMTPLLARLPDTPLNMGGRDLISFFSKTMMMPDPPKHTVLRKAMQHAFTTKAVLAQQPAIESMAEQLIARLSDDGNGQFDLVSDLAYPLPTLVIADWLGAEASDRDQFKAWSDDILDFVTTYVRKDPTEIIIRAASSLNEMKQYLTDLLEHYRRHPNHNLMGHLIKLQQTYPELSDDDLLANAILLVVAGHETTTHLITNCFYVLQQYPNLYEEIIENPMNFNFDAFIDEVLRYESPVQRVARIATADFDLGDQPIQTGDRIICLLGASNRDPRHFETPNRFKLNREHRRHFAFGSGMHHCIGAYLAKLETKTVLRQFFQSYRIKEWPVEPLLRTPNPSMRAIISYSITTL